MPLAEDLDPDYQGAQDTAVQKRGSKSSGGGHSWAPLNDARLSNSSSRKTRTAPPD